VATATKERHFLAAKFVDKGSKPITGVQYTIKGPDGKTSEGTLAGEIETGVDQAGNYEIALMAITKATWSVAKAQNGETVKMQAETLGFQDGTKVTFEVWERDIGQADRRIAVKGDIPLKSGKAEAEWKYEWPEDKENTPPKSDKLTHYYAPRFYFFVMVGSCQEKSGILDYKDFIEIKYVDEYGRPGKDMKYRVFLPNGEVREGKLDGDGYAKIENVPPGPWNVEFPEADADLKEGKK
jgi:hypothetical protein